ncbi:MAG: imidazoleglycerol-phosphate dehydratase, partial [Cyanobacteria bacterium J06635_11]
MVSSVPKASANTDLSTPASQPVPTDGAQRVASVSRTTKETDVQVTLNVDGTGKCTADTGIPFLDHMLHQIASHGLFDLEVRATGDIEIDDHHTNEDVG